MLSAQPFPGGFSTEAMGKAEDMVIGAIAGAWMLMLLLVLALCRAAAAVDTP